MNKLVLITVMSSTLLMSGCDYFKKKKEESNSVLSEWSCTNESNIDQIQKYLKDQYLQEVSNGLANSSYEADQALLLKINNGVFDQSISLSKLNVCKGYKTPDFLCF